MENAVTLPSVYVYLDFRAFLRDWFEAKKLQEPGYSYAAFAAAGDCSKSTLANVISGTRSPRPETLDAFAHAMGLAPAERNYLGLLADLTSAATLEERREVMDRILSAERYQRVRIAESEHDDDAFRFLEHWYIPAIHELVGLPGFREDSRWIARTLTPQIEPEQAQQTLDLLLELGFTRRDRDGRLEQQAIRFRTRPEAQPAAAGRFHREVVPSLLRRLDTSKSSEQHLLAATIALPPELLPEAKARLNKVYEQLATLADDRRNHGPHRIYQVAMVLLPLSQDVS